MNAATETSFETYFLTLNATFATEHDSTLRDSRASSETLMGLHDEALFHANTATDCGAHIAAASWRKLAITIRYMAEARCEVKS